MAISLDIPGGPHLDLRYLLLDLNGTLTDRGQLLPGVATGLMALRDKLDIRILTADTYGTADQITATLDVPWQHVRGGRDKAAYADGLGASACVAIGNGANDETMLREAGLGIAVLGPEGASPKAIATADVVCSSIEQALLLLDDPTALIATLRL